MEKTYKLIVEKPRVEVYYDRFADNPRYYVEDNLGYFFTSNDADVSPNKPEHNLIIHDIMIDTGNGARNTDDHIKLMTDRINTETDEKVLAIYPVYCYDHGNVLYKRGTAEGFDYSNSGFYIITDKTLKNLGSVPEGFEQCVDRELETYTQWANGEVYGIKLFDENGEEFDGQGELYSFEDMHAGMPADFQKTFSIDDLKELLK